MDEIKISKLKVFAHHGVYQEEQEKGQNFYINAVLRLSIREASGTDELDKTVNYGEVCEKIEQVVTEKTYQLIESVAERVASCLLLTYPLIREVSVEVEKPEAPITIPFQNVSVAVTRKWNRVVIATGANQGNPREQIITAMVNLDKEDEFRILKKSELVESTPYGGVEQANFVNGAFLAETLYSPLQLLHRLKEEEKAAHRVKTEHWGPRMLDLDIIYYEDLVMDTEELTIPHIDMKNRDFVLNPVAEICPYKKHPVYNLTAYEMLKNMSEFHINPDSNLQP